MCNIRLRLMPIGCGWFTTRLSCCGLFSDRRSKEWIKTGTVRMGKTFSEDLQRKEVQIILGIDIVIGGERYIFAVSVIRYQVLITMTLSYTNVRLPLSRRSSNPRPSQMPMILLCGNSCIACSLDTAWTVQARMRVRLRMRRWNQYSASMHYHGGAKT